MGSWFSALGDVRPFGPRQEIDVMFTYSPAEATRVARNALGQFTSAQAEIGAELEGLAIRLQEMQVEALHRIQEEHPGGPREQRGTHYLEDAVLSPANRHVTAETMVVGIEAAFAETPAASYWRGLETGTSVHVGQRMWGLWITPGGFSGPIGADPEDPHDHGPRDAIGFRAWPGIPEDQWDSYVRPYKDGSRPKSRGAKLNRLPAFTIHQPIPEYAYLRTGIRDFMESGAIEQAMTRAIERATRVQNVAIERGITTAAARVALAAEG